MATSQKSSKKTAPKAVRSQPTKAVTKPSASPEFNDDVYTYRSNEFEQIRGSLGMYVGSTEDGTGSMHLVNEITANSLDECINPNSPGDTIFFTFMEKPQKFIIEDNGRGIPHEILLDVISKKHYSTKFNREFSHYSGGQNGVGTTITAALSDHYLVTSYRNGIARTVYTLDDQLVDGGEKKCKPDKHGTYTEFIPSQKWLGKYNLTVDDVEAYLRSLSYVLPPKVKIKFLSINKKGKEEAKTIKPMGIVSDVEYISQSLDFNPIYIRIPEIVIEKDDADAEYFRLEFAFSYDRNIDDAVVDSFCNYLHTKEGGTHENVCLQAISTFFVRQAKELDPNNKYEVISDDCKKGLILCVNCDHSNPKFEGQHKSKVDQKNIVQYGRKPIIQALEKFFETNNGLLRKIIMYLRQMAKIRQEAHKIKSTTIKKMSTFLDDAEMKFFTNVSDRNYNGYKELFLAEGLSAVAAVGSARNVKCQGIYAITGVVANTFNMTTEQVMQNPTYQTLVKILGCGIGKDFDISKLKWSAIIIATDADVDGHNIKSLLCVFFAKHMPEIIRSGKLYVVMPPLYRLSPKDMKKFNLSRDYLFDKNEYYAIYHKNIVENLKLAMVTPKTKTDIIKGKGEVVELNKKDGIHMLHQTVDYLDELRGLVKRSACPMEVLEYICYFWVMASHAPGDRMSLFEEMVHKKFPELHYDSVYQSIIGSYKGENIALIVDDIFQKMARRMFRLIDEAPTFYILVKKRHASKTDPQPDNWDLMSYGQFLEMCDGAFQVDVEQRYKGLGESDASMIFPSMMNPKTRRLIRLTMDDIPAAIEVMNLLHGDGEKLREARRDLLRNADITLQDIDN